MSLLCKILGHKLETCFYTSDGLFFRIGQARFDGIGRAHRQIYSECERCKKNIPIGKCIDGLMAAKEEGK